CMQSLDFPLTF
nr:immunoglobulin light chain junction region [Macaca mulatta]MOV77543.1 immunoglobulin light chain junction region [Macaca mulatta]MOV77664.1 immunoglobulin light chain junction region [Macaca mulatta]MOV77668.1 immunoglobulin light chain junction region [Macaca mulatta]MOV77698.1 immunoglobulin light chain junction region [Macaca mulatta]